MADQQISSTSASSMDRLTRGCSSIRGRLVIGWTNFWTIRSLRQKQAIAGVGVLIVALSLILVITSSAKHRTELIEAEVCTTDACSDTAQIFKENLDTSVNPCDDFYTYACGNFKQHNNLSQGESFVNFLTQHQRQVESTLIKSLSKKSSPKDIPPVAYIRNFFAQATNKSRLEQNDFTRLRQLELQIQRCKTLEELLIISATVAFPSLFGFYEKFGDVFLVCYVRSETDRLNSPFSEMEPYGVDKRYREISSLLKIYYEDKSLIETDDLAKDIIKIERILRRMPPRPDPDRAFTRYTGSNKDDLRKNIKGLDLVKVLDRLLGGANSSIDELYVETKSFNRLVALVNESKITLQSWKNYLTWDLIENLGWTVSSKIVEEKKVHSFEKKVLEQLTFYLPSVVGRLYVDEIGFDQKEKKIVEDIYDRVKESMFHFIENSTWMDEATKMSAAKYLSQMNIVVGYPDWIMNDTELQTQLTFNLNPLDGPFETILKACKAKVIYEPLAMLHAPGTKKFLPFSPAVVTEEVNLFQRQFLLSAGFLSGALHDSDRPEHINLAIIGTIIAQEMIEFEQHFYYIWSNETISNFHKREKQMIDLYNSIVDDRTNLTLVGPFINQHIVVPSINSKIGENAGIRIAHKAYLDQASTEQRLPAFEDWNANKTFFLSFANTFCEISSDEFARNSIAWFTPPKYRVNIPLSNYEAFADAFECKLGSKMNPKNKVRVW